MFSYAENIERSFDKKTKLSFSNLNDAIRSSADIKHDIDVFDTGNSYVGSKAKYYHIPGNSSMLKCW